MLQLMRCAIFFLVMLALARCVDHQDIINEIKIITWTDPLKGLPDKGPLRFDLPEIGQRSYYVYFKASSLGPGSNVQYEYLTDTLVVAISEKKSTSWILKEYFTAGSFSFHSQDGTFDTDSVYVTIMSVDQDSVFFARPHPDLYSTYFFYFERDQSIKLPLAPVSDPALQNANCSPFYYDHFPNGMEYTLDYEQLGQTFDHLNIFADYSELEVDGPGLMYVYDPAHGFVRRTGFNPWTSKAGGWDLVPR